MTPPSPATNATGVVTFTITSAGTPIADDIQVIAVETWNRVNKIPRARLVMFDGSMTDGAFPVSDGATFVPGSEVQIDAGYAGTNETIFKGIVVRHRLDIAANGSSALVVDLADKALALTVTRNMASFADKKDSDVMSDVIGAAGLSADVEATTVTHKSFVQFGASDWDTILYRAEMNGLLVSADAGTVTVKAPDTSGSAALQITYGTDLVDFHAELDAVSQLSDSAITSYAWDPSTQALLTGTASSVTVTEAGNLSATTLADVLAVSAFDQRTGGSLTADDLAAWSSARLLRAKLARLRGRVRFQGSALAKVGGVLALDGVGARFNGNVFISGVQHAIRNGQWLTTVEFGLAPDAFADQPSAAGPSAAGQLAPARGLHTGVVTQIHEDPDGQFRVQVKLPLVGDEAKMWARLNTWYATSSAGAFFYPEVGDEVIVGFMNEDPRFPVILGSVHSSKFSPPKTPDDKNTSKALVTKSKMELSFDDTDKVIVLQTPGKHVVTLTDKDKKVTIVDSAGNAITMSSDGVTIESKSNLTLKASGDISLEATGNVKMKATANASLEGLQVDVKAQTAASVQGQASAELKSSGMLTVQGSLVKIN